MGNRTKVFVGAIALSAATLGMVVVSPAANATYTETRSFSGPSSAGGARYYLTIQVKRTV